MPSKFEFGLIRIFEEDVMKMTEFLQILRSLKVCFLLKYLENISSKNYFNEIEKAIVFEKGHCGLFTSYSFIDQKLGYHKFYYFHRDLKFLQKKS